MDKNSVEIKALIEKMESDRKNLFDERKVYIEQLEIEKNKKDYSDGKFNETEETKPLEEDINKISSELNVIIGEIQKVKNEIRIYEY